MSSIDTNKKVPELRKVTIMSTGTRGDIQPFVSIGIALKKAGHAVRIMTQPSETHETLVSFGVGWDRHELAGLWREAVEESDTLQIFKLLAALVENNTRESCEPFHEEFVASQSTNILGCTQSIS